MMSKKFQKLLGGGILLACLLMLGVSLFVTTSSTKANNNVVYSRTVIVHWVCPGSSHVTVSTTTEEERWGEKVNHPPPRWVSRWVAWWGDYGLVEEHTPHDVEELCVANPRTTTRSIDYYHPDFGQCR